MVEIMDGLMDDARFLVSSAIGVMALVFVIMTWVRTRSLVPTLGAILLGAVVLWGVANFPVLQREINEDIERHNTSRSRAGD